MEKKFLVELGKTKKLFNCPSSLLMDKVRDAFKIRQSFQLQVFDKDFKQWADVTDIENLPTLSELRVQVCIGKA